MLANNGLFFWMRETKVILSAFVMRKELWGSSWLSQILEIFLLHQIGGDIGKDIEILERSFLILHISQNYSALSTLHHISEFSFKHKVGIREALKLMGLLSE